MFRRVALAATKVLKSTSEASSRSVALFDSCSPLLCTATTSGRAGLTATSAELRRIPAAVHASFYATNSHGPAVDSQTSQDAAPVAEAAAGAAGRGDTHGGEQAGAVDSTGQEDLPPLTPEELAAQFQRVEEQLEEHKQQVKELKDKLLLSYADMENLRTRSAQQVETNRKFAVQGFVKDLLDVADNLERAADAVPSAALTGSDVSPSDIQKQLRILLEGVQMTQKVLNQGRVWPFEGH